MNDLSLRSLRDKWLSVCFFRKRENRISSQMGMNHVPHLSLCCILQYYGDTPTYGGHYLKQAHGNQKVEVFKNCFKVMH